MMMVDHDWLRRRPITDVGAPADDWKLPDGWTIIKGIVSAPPAPVAMADPALEQVAPPASEKKRWSLADDWMNMPR